MAQRWRRLRTQTEAYWRDFQVTEQDIEYLYNFFLEKETPRSIDDLAIKVVGRRCQLEEEKMARESDRGAIYRPQDKYAVGQRVVFPALGYAAGEVLGVRPGRNPKYGPFEVIQVQLEGEERVREFASSFTQPHLLNHDWEESGNGGEVKLTPPQLYALYGASTVRERLQAALQEHDEFVQLNGQWFLRALLPEVHIGHLNIAEAMIDMARAPLSTDDLLKEIGLAQAKPEAQRFALELALLNDERFDEVGKAGERRWFLFSLEPAAAVSTPPLLRAAYPRPPLVYLTAELIEFSREIGDELDESPDSAAEGTAESATVMLNYPHWREGTIPLTRAVRQLLPKDAGVRFPITLLDPRSKVKMPGWVLLEDRYLWGLDAWYRAQEVPVGGSVTIARTEDPFCLAVSVEQRQRRGEWVKEARVEDGRLTFGMQRQAYRCPYDRYLLLHIPDDQQGRLANLASKLAEQNPPLFRLILDIVPELLKLSSQGVFHAKSLYAAVNLVRRCGAVPIFAELTKRACFDPVGAGNWAFDPELKDFIYGTEEEMRNRPHSRRDDVIRDLVTLY